jgi:uncharacterized membrane protein
MIFKDSAYKKDKKINPFTGVLLFFVSIILLVITAPFGLLYGFFYTLFKKGLRGIGEYALKMAISIDQLGNVTMQHLLNLLWLKKGAYHFGNRDETISSALGRNKKLGLLNGFGLKIDHLLDRLDPDHTLNSIDYYIEPTDQIIDKLAWIHLLDGRILSTLSVGKSTYNIPCGNRELGETDALALTREIKKALSVELITATMKPVGIFEAQIDDLGAGILVRMNCYEAEYNETIIPENEITEVVWLSYKDREMVSEVDKLIFDFLKEKEQLL